MTEKNKQPDPRTAEAQLYQRIETARAKIYGLINQIIRETGLPAVLVCNLVREVTTETMLTFERQAHGQTRAELAAVKGELEKLREEVQKKGKKISRTEG